MVRSRGDGDRQDVYRGAAFRHACHSDTFSTLFGLFASRENRRRLHDTARVGRARRPTLSPTAAATRTPMFGTAIWRFATRLGTVGRPALRQEDREQDTPDTISTRPGVVLPDPHASSIRPKCSRASR